MFARYGRGGRGGNQGRMAAPPKASADAAVAIAPRNRNTFGSIRGKANNNSLKASATSSSSTAGLNNYNNNNTSHGTEETFSLIQPSPVMPFAMIIRLIPDLIGQIRRAQAQGKDVRIKFGRMGTNSNVNIIDVGGKEFKFTWASEQGDLCDIYEEQQSGEEGEGVLVASGSAWRKLNVQPILNESMRENLKLRSEEAARQQKFRKAIVLDHATPVAKPSKPLVFSSNDVNPRKLPGKSVKEPPAKKQKTDPGSATDKSGFSPMALPSEHVDSSTQHQPSSPEISTKQKDKVAASSSVPALEKEPQSSATISKSELRNLLVTQLTENPKGLSIKAIEKLIRLEGKTFAPILKEIANYQAPGRYVLKPELEKGSDLKLMPHNSSSPEAQHIESPVEIMSPLSDKVADQNEDKPLQVSPKQDSYLNIMEESDDHINESPGVDVSAKPKISDGSVSSSSGGSGSDSDSDTGSSASGSASGSSSDSDSNHSSSSGEVSDENVDIMSDDDNEKEKAESGEKGRDEFGENFDGREIAEEKEEGQLFELPRHSEEVDILDDYEDVSNIAEHYTEKILVDHADDYDMAVDVDVFDCEGEVKTPKDKLADSPVHGGQCDIKSPTGENRISREKEMSNDNSVDNNLQMFDNTTEINNRAPDHRVFAQKRNSKDKDIRQSRESAPVQSSIDPPKSDKNSERKATIDSQQPNNGNRKAKETDDKEWLDQHVDGKPSSSRIDDCMSKPKDSNVLPRCVRQSSSSRKTTKGDERVSISSSDNDGSGQKTITADEKHLRQKMNVRSIANENAAGRIKQIISTNISKDAEKLERYAACIDSQNQKPVDQTVNLSKDVGMTEQISIHVTSNDNNVEDGKLRRECSDLELGELREPFIEEEQHQSKIQSEKSHSGRNIMHNKAKDGARRESDNYDFMKRSESRKQSLAEQIGDNKCDVQTGKRLLEDGISSCTRPSKKPAISQTRHSLQSDGPDVDNVSRQERIMDMPVKVHSSGIAKTSPSLAEPHLKTNGSNKNKPENKWKVKDATIYDQNDLLQKSKENAYLTLKNKEDWSGEKNGISIQKTGSLSDEDFYGKYDRDEAELKGPITNIAEYKEYIREHEEKYSVYINLHKALESDKEYFQQFKKDLSSAKARGDISSYKDISEKVIQAHNLQGSKHKQMKRIFVVLHNELNNLKQRVQDFYVQFLQR